MSSRFVGQKLQKEDPPNMASEVCRTEGTLQRGGEEPVGLNRFWGHLLPHRLAVILKFPTTLPKTGFGIRLRDVLVVICPSSAAKWFL